MILVFIIVFTKKEILIIYKSDLIKAGLIDENEISKLNTWGGVKGELLSNDRIRYTVEYINAENNEYTNEELYLMIQNNTNKINNMSGSTGDGSTSTEVIENLQTQINNLTDKDNANNIFLQNYPVGSIFVTTDSTNPSTKFGGTWVTYGEGRTLVGVDSTQTEFASVGLTGGEKTHTLTIDEMPSHTHHAPTEVATSSSYHIYTSGSEYYINGVSSGYQNTAGYYWAARLTDSGRSEPHNNLQPYITVYMWKRTA